MLHGLLLLSDEVAQVDVVLVEVHDAARINRGRTRKQVDLPATSLHKKVLGAGDRKFDVKVRDWDDLRMDVVGDILQVRAMSLERPRVLREGQLGCPGDLARIFEVASQGGAHLRLHYLF